MYDNPCCFLIYKYNINCNHALHAVIVSHKLFIICIFCHYTDRGNMKPHYL